jgi:DNA-binding XRE family transcriptional regulator
MKKNNAEKIKFIPLEKVIQKKLKSGKFKKSFYKEIGRLQLAHDIKVLRQKKGMTQKQIAAKADMPQSVIARLESGNHNVSATTLYKIADALDKQIGFIEPAQNRR